MKISKDLLKQIALGVCFTGAVASCGIHDDPLGEDEQSVICEAHDAEDTDTKEGWDNCMACGMG